jgi:hypothetical protein
MTAPIAPEPAVIPADVSVARAELIAVALRWHASERWAKELHKAAERYETARDVWLDAMVAS